MKGGLHHLLVLLDSPLVTFEYATVFALEHLGCIFAAFQLPIKPSDGGKTELSAMRLTVCAAVTYWLMYCESSVRLFSLDVGLAVLVCIFFLASKDVDNRTMDFL